MKKFFNYKNSSIYKNHKLSKEFFKENKVFKILFILMILYPLIQLIINGYCLSKGLNYYKNSFLYRHNNILLFLPTSIVLLYFYYFRYLKRKKLQERIIGYYEKSSDTFLCNQCYSQIADIDKQNYEAIKTKNLQNNIYECDKCKKKFD